MKTSLRGHCLIAAKHLRDPNFYKSVVLMVEHNDEGALGIVVNRPSATRVFDALGEHFELPESPQPVFVGGPVEPNGLLLLHNQPQLASEVPPVVEDLYLGNDPQVFENVMRQVASSALGLEYRVFSGCAGWGPQQLESELNNGDWHTVTATRQLVFSANAYEVYERALASLLVNQGLFPGVVGRPGLN